MEKGKNRLKKFIIFIAFFIILIFSIKPLVFTFHYIKSLYSLFYVKDRTLYYKEVPYLIKNPRFFKLLKMPYFRDAYVYGVISEYTQKKSITGDKIKYALSILKDNIYLNYINEKISGEKKEFNYENFDSLSLNLMGEKRFNKLTSEVFKHYGEKIGDDTKALLLLYFYLSDKKDSVSLMEDIFKVKTESLKGFLKDSKTETEISPKKLLSEIIAKLYYDNIYLPLKDFNSKCSSLLENDNTYKKLLNREKSLREKISEMSKIYKIGYPPYKKALEEYKSVRSKRAEYKNTYCSTLKGRLLNLRNKFLAESSEFDIEKYFSSENLKNLNILKTFIYPGKSDLVDSISRIKLKGIQKILDENFTNPESFKDKWFYSLMANRRPFSPGSFSGVMYNSKYYDFCFFTKKNSHFSPSRGGIWFKRKIKNNGGIYAVTLRYKLFYGDEKATLWTGPRIGEKALFKDKDFMYFVYLFSYDKRDVPFFKPLLRIWSKGIFIIDRISLFEFPKSSPTQFKQIGFFIKVKR